MKFHNLVGMNEQYSFITTPRFSKNIEVRCDFQDYVSLISTQH